ncbi:Phenylacetic acid catabolic protein [Kitasatospora sp. NPDC089509]|uniref:Phenylacetic acid catabolic protein n=1 Tax=Kitasatospora sp. NPDC089509 TaxID=3364079 RepID=UPI0038118181
MTQPDTTDEQAGAPEREVFEVFLQTGSTTPLSHVGSLLATDRAQAWRLAREAYGRRDDAVRLWVVRRDHVHTEADGRRLLDAKSRMPYRLPAFPQERRRRRSGLRTTELHRATASVLAGATTPTDDRTAATARWASIADDLFLHSHHLAELTVDYTELEEALAVGSIAQEDLAHARTIMGLLGCDDAAADAHFFDRSLERWQPTALTACPRDDRPWSVARGLLMAAGTSALLLSALGAPGGAAPGSSDAALRSALRAMADEQRLHLKHWAARVRHYRHTSHHRAMAEAMSAATAAAQDLFGPALPVRLPDPAAAMLPEVSAAACTDRFDRLWQEVVAEPGPAPVLPRPAPARRPGDRLPAAEQVGLRTALEQLRAVRAGYPDGAFR